LTHTVYTLEKTFRFSRKNQRT